MDDIFSQFGDIFGDDLFGSFFGGGGGRRGGGARARGVKGSNLRVKIKLNYEEIAKGVTKNIKVKKYVTCNTCTGSGAKDKSSVQTCSTCGGSGQVRKVTSTFLGQMQTVTTCPTCNGEGVVITNPCTNCQGEGRVRENRRLVVRIPAGVDEHSQIRLTGEGDAGPRGAPPGDLYIELSIKPHKLFRRQGFDVLLDLPLNIAQASLGADLQVPTLDGPQDLKIPAGTQHDKLFRLKERGVPHLRGSGRGDQLVRVRVEVPNTLTDEQRQLLPELPRPFGDDNPTGQAAEKGFFGRIKDVLGGQ